MPPEPPSTPPGLVPGLRDAFTDVELLALLEALLARPLDYPEAHVSVCARVAIELLGRLLLRLPAGGESKAVH